MVRRALPSANGISLPELEPQHRIAYGVGSTTACCEIDGAGSFVGARDNHLKRQLYYSTPFAHDKIARHERRMLNCISEAFGVMNTKGSSIDDAQ